MAPDTSSQGEFRSHAIRAVLRTQRDSRLVPLIRAGDEPAFSELARRHQARLRSLSRSLGADHHSAEDIVQEALLRAKAAIEAGTEPGLMGAWLRGIVRNATLNWIRVNPQKSELTDRAAPHTDPAALIEQREEIRSLVACISELPKQQRKAIIARELDGLSVNEISTTLGVSVGAARQLIFRARETLRARRVGVLLPLPLHTALGKTGTETKS